MTIDGTTAISGMTAGSHIIRRSGATRHRGTANRFDSRLSRSAQVSSLIVPHVHLVHVGGYEGSAVVFSFFSFARNSGSRCW